MDIEYVGFADIVKTEKQADGTLMVFGKATGPDLDLDKQVCDPSWLGKAMPDWFSTGGNVREQHSSVAAGVAKELTVDGDDYWVKTLVVDPTSVAKVEAGVLQGYSVGIKAPKVVKDAAAPGGRIVGGQIVEVSLVDRPCNPTCKMTLAKAVGVGEEVAPEVFDKGLVKVEELVEDGGDAPLDAVGLVAAAKATAADLTKADKGDKYGHAKDFAKAWKAISKLIGQEAAESEGGNNETDCIDVLNSALRRLETYARLEAAEGENVRAAQKNPDDPAMAGAGNDTNLYFGVEADLTKGARKAVKRLAKAADLDLSAPVETIDKGWLGSLVANLIALDPTTRSALADVVAKTLGITLPAMPTAGPLDPSQALSSSPTVAGSVTTDMPATAIHATGQPSTDTLDSSGAPQLTAAPKKSKKNKGADADKTTAPDETKTDEADERIKALEAELVKVKQMAAPGGPVRARTKAETVSAVKVDEAQAYRQKAAAIENEDPILAEGYLELAAEAEQRAAKAA